MDTSGILDESSSERLGRSGTRGIAVRAQLTTGLQTMVPFWREAIDMVLDVEPGEWDWFRPPRVPDRPNLSEEDSSKIPDVARTGPLFGDLSLVVHALQFASQPDHIPVETAQKTYRSS
jgi:hypothetical protein